MGKLNKILGKVLSGSSDSNIDFNSLCYLLIRLGFTERIKGDHHIFTKPRVDEIINIQPKGSKAKAKAKAYQVKQARNVIVKYQMSEVVDE